MTTMVEALNAGLRSAMQADPKVVLLGEDIGKLGGVFRVTDALQAEFGEQRVLDTPLAESGIVGTALGLALRGYRPVCEIQFDGFVYPAFDQIVSQVARIGYRTGGKVMAPLTIRIPYGGGIGAVEHHSESPEAHFVHTPGLRVVVPSTPADAFLMIQQAIAIDDPVIFLEPKCRYWDRGDNDLTNTAEALPLHRARIVRSGTDATLVAYGSMVQPCLEAAEQAATEGHSLEVVDLRSLAPIDFDLIEESVRRTHRLAIIHEAPVTCGVGAEVAARVAQDCFYQLQAPVLRICGFDTPYPASKLEKFYRPDAGRILYTVDELLAA